MILLLDVGSTFVKYGIYDEISNSIKKYKLPFPKPSVDDGVKFEINLEDIKKIICKIFDFAKNEKCLKAFISVQMHGYILKIRDDFGNYVSWRDKRGNIFDNRLKKYNFDRNGTSLKTNLPAVSLLSYNNNFFDAEFFTLGSYIAYMLTGRNITHITDGCACGFFDAQTLERIDLFPELKLPDVTQDVDYIGNYNGIRIYTPMGDHQVSFLGSGAAEDSYLLNIGTATQISGLDEYADDLNSEKRPYFYKSKRLFTVSGLTGGHKLFEEGLSYTLFDEITEGLKNLPSKKNVLLGGGGANIVYEQLKEYLKQYDITCSAIDKDIGMEGLKMIADEKRIEIGTMLSEVCFSNIPIIFKNAGFDYFIVDSEHGSFDYSALSSLCMVSKLCGIRCIIRISDNTRMNITKLADMGAGGFLLPMTNCAEDIKKVVNYAKYSPIGRRGISTNRAHTLYNPSDIRDYMKTANHSMKIYAQIETRKGCENIDEILNVDGVDGVFIGPNDLSCDLDCMGDNGPIIKNIELIKNACVKKEKKWGIITTDEELIAFCRTNDVNMISYGSEINMLKNGCKAIKEMF